MRAEPNENDIAGCVECGEPLNQRPSFHCSKCLPPPRLDSVGPFPQEPAPGSPEAVAIAAETIHGLSWRRNPLADIVSTIGSEEARQALAWASREDAEVDKIAAEALREGLADLTAEEQRDALADAVLPLMGLLEDRFVGASAAWKKDAQAALAVGREALRKAGR